MPSSCTGLVYQDQLVQQQTLQHLANLFVVYDSLASAGTGYATCKMARGQQGF